ncbi:MAG: imelysin family protein [Nannocystales bacterium]
MTRRSLHLTLAATAMVVWACADPGGETTAGSSTGAADASETEGGTPASESGSQGSTDGAGVTAEDVLISLADNVFAPTHAAFSEAADALSSAAATHAQAVADGGDVATSREAVEVAFGDLAVALQHVELLQLGPAAGSSGIEGEFLRDELYSWPAVNTCRIDQELVVGEYGAADFTDTRLVNVYGFDALEYLLFSGSPDNTCPPQLPINGSGEWDALGEAEVEVRRAAYAAGVASAMATVADDLESTWAEGGAWHGYLSDPSSGPLESTSAAMDEVLRAMFYIDKSLKDIKLARPAGIKDCSADVCLDEVESLWAGLSKEQAVANLAAFRQLMWAGPSADEGVGFDDLLSAVGEGALGEEMLADTTAAIDALEAVEGTFVDALTADAAALDASHAAVVELTDDLKGDFPIVLMLNVPSEAAGDAD